MTERKPTAGTEASEAASQPHRVRERLTIRLFGREPLRALRIRRTLLGFVSYLTYLPALAVAVHLGWVRGGWGSIAAILLLVIAANTLFYALIRSGITERWSLSDPSLTAVQIATASLVILLLLAVLRRGTDLFLSLYFASFFFGVFQLKREEYLRVALFAILAFLTFFFWRLTAQGYPLRAVGKDAVSLLILVTLLVWISLMGGYVSTLREKNRRARAELEQALARIRELSVRDDLTGLWNRRHLREILEREIARIERRGNTEPDGLALAVLDIDNFKTINDTFGHGVGDEVLKAVAVRLETTLRRQDWIAHPGGSASSGDPEILSSTVGRFGGDEFVLVLPETGERGAQACLERVFRAVADEPVATTAGPVRVSLSVGAACRRAGESSAQLFARADRALYRAKAAGRGCFFTDEASASET